MNSHKPDMQGHSKTLGGKWPPHIPEQVQVLSLLTRHPSHLQYGCRMWCMTRTRARNMGLLCLKTCPSPHKTLRPITTRAQATLAKEVAIFIFLQILFGFASTFYLTSQTTGYQLGQGTVLSFPGKRNKDDQHQNGGQTQESHGEGKKREENKGPLKQEACAMEKLGQGCSKGSLLCLN